MGRLAGIEGGREGGREGGVSLAQVERKKGEEEKESSTEAREGGRGWGKTGKKPVKAARERGKQEEGGEGGREGELLWDGRGRKGGKEEEREGGGRWPHQEHFRSFVPRLRGSLFVELHANNINGERSLRCCGVIRISCFRWENGLGVWARIEARCFRLSS